MMEKTKEVSPTSASHDLGAPEGVTPLGNGALTPVEARAILQAEAQTRVEACQVQIQKVLNEYNCQIDVAVLLRAGQVIPQVQIISR